MSTLSEDTLDGLAKEDLIVRAQPHSDSSFSVPSDPSKFYTAWASMKTLETKELVYKFGRPIAKYALTDEGWEVAKRMKQTLGVDDLGITEPERGLPPTQRFGQENGVKLRDESQQTASRHRRSKPPDSLISNGDLRRDRSSQLETVNRNEDYLLEKSAEEIVSPSSRQQQRKDSDLQRAGFARLPTSRINSITTVEADSDIEIIDDLPPKPTSSARPTEARGIGKENSDESRRIFMQELENRIFSSDVTNLDDHTLAKALVAARELISSQNQGQRKSLSRTVSNNTFSNAVSNTQKPSSTRRTENQSIITLPLAAKDVNRAPRVVTGNVEKVDISKTSRVHTPVARRPAVAESPDLESINVPAGSFTVELVVDTREVRTKIDRDYIPSKLATFGVHCTSRAMELGDMLWVARIHDLSVKRKLERSDQEVPEIVLDHIIERKRLDDLDASIKDSRFTEQKFRLKRSGIPTPIYLVEDYGSIGYMPEEQHQRLVTSITATQVLNGFFVKRTRSLDDTIAYLARMTKLLKKQYEGKPLTVIPSSALTPQNHIQLRNPGSGTTEQESLKRYITYSSFASLLHKSSTLTLRDVFLKMLMCTRGITGEKAIEIQRHWETPRAFVEALERAGGQLNGSGSAANRTTGATKKRELVWSVAGDLVGRRKIGKAVSARVGEIWGFQGTTF